MEGLSTASGVIAVLSLTVQLANSVKELYEFWSSIQEAPAEVRDIVANLKLLSCVLENIIEFEAGQNYINTDDTLKDVLESCGLKVRRFTDLVSSFEKGFVSKKRTIRTWAALKAVLKAEKVKQFRTALEELKMTLLLAQQNHLW
ncbi:hypothetical protein MMC14_003009 [Varicellaria rhodocarpa]|nr:hypothetical protein [Varicellaria rhodocarpa]